METAQNKPMQTLDQKIASITHGHIKEMQPISSEICGHIKKTAARLRTAGLGITIAFCLKDGEKKDLKPIADAIAACLSALPGVTGVKTATDLQSRYLNGDMAEVRLLTTYAEHILEWLGRWADSYKVKEEKKD